MSQFADHCKAARTAVEAAGTDETILRIVVKQALDHMSASEYDLDDLETMLNSLLGIGDAAITRKVLLELHQSEIEAFK